MHERTNLDISAGVRLFDEGRFFEAHEAWEESWRIESNDERRMLLQGLIQVAAGFHKLIVKRAPDSARRLLSKGISKLDACAIETIACSMGDEPLDVASFRERVRVCAATITNEAPDASALPKFAEAASARPDDRAQRP